MASQLNFSHSLLLLDWVLDIDISWEMLARPLMKTHIPVASRVLWRRRSNKLRLYDVEFISLLSRTSTAADNMPRHYCESLAWILSVESWDMARSVLSS